MTAIKIRGYCDTPSVAPGESLKFYVSCDDPGQYRAELVRLINGDLNPDGPGVQETPIEHASNRHYEARWQRTQVGGHVLIDDPGRSLAFTESFTVNAFISAMLPGQGQQTIISRWDSEAFAGWSLAVDQNGFLTFTLGSGNGETTSVTSDRRLFPDTFYSVTAVYDSDESTLTLHQTSVVNSVNSRFGKVVPIDSDTTVSAEAAVTPATPDVPTIIAGASESASEGRIWVTDLFNGKIDRPTVIRGTASAEDAQLLAQGIVPENSNVAARWDFAAGTTKDGLPTDRVLDVSIAELHGTCVNQPDRGMTGWNWDGVEENFKHCPEQYGAIWFHADSLDDSRWDADFECTVPADLKSGCYAYKLTQDGSTDYIPFFVRPPRGKATAKVLLLIPTYSYLAYANSQVMQNAPSAQAIMGHVAVLEDTDIELNERPEIYGLSTYDYHGDGRGCQYTTWRRPILNMRPRYRHEFGSVWQFPADLHLVDWLSSCGFDVDIATDHDLHEEGSDLFKRYNVVVSGTHPEYYSRQMIDAWEEYLAAGGRGMYLAGNGMYWIASPHPEKPWVVEIRKGEQGDQAWRARPGELYHSTSGERGGLWRMRGRASAKVWGVVYTSHGLDVSTGFTQMPDARHPKLDWMFDGIGPDEVIGDFGLVGGGASGLEVDRYDQMLGTPPNTYLVASSYGHSPNWGLVPEEQYFVHSGMNGPEHPSVRGDITYFSSKNGGAMFSSSSMTWCASLSWNDYQNNVSQLTANVLRKFATDGPVEEI
jgi:N,N-dimethylformamidase